jgi:DNA-binding ferritin-like protein
MNSILVQYDKLAKQYDALASEYIRLAKEKSHDSTQLDSTSIIELCELRNKASTADKLQKVLEYKDNVIEVLSETLESANRRVDELSNKLQIQMLANADLLQRQRTA